MCVICIKPIGAPMPGYAKIKRAFKKNKDGAGYMFPYEGEVHIRKGFFDAKSFREDVYKTFSRLDLDIKQTPIVFHCRITTSGGTKAENCHPFPLTDSVEELKATEIKSNVGIAHNGVIKSIYKGDISDTMWFIKDCLSGLSFYQFKNTAVQNLIKEVITSDRMVFMNGDGEYVHIGHWNEDGPYLWSNTSFKKPTYNYSHTNKGYSYGSFDSYDDYWFRREAKKNYTKSTTKGELVDFSKKKAEKDATKPFGIYSGAIFVSNCDCCGDKNKEVINIAGVYICADCFWEDFDGDEKEVLGSIEDLKNTILH